MSHTIPTAVEQDNRERRRAFDAAVEHRGAMQRLARDLKLADTIDEADRIVDKMRRVGNEYEAWLRAENARMQVRYDERPASAITADALA